MHLHVEVHVRVATAHAWQGPCAWANKVYWTMEQIYDTELEFLDEFCIYMALATPYLGSCAFCHPSRKNALHMYPDIAPMHFSYR
jgi:hypothetical protein